MHHMFGGPGFWGGPGFFGIPWGSLFLFIAAGVIIYLLVRRTKPAEACSGVCRSGCISRIDICCECFGPARRRVGR